MSREPDLSGPFGAAWQVPLPAGHPSAATEIVSWFLHLPNQGLGWDKYLLEVISLADLPNKPPANPRYPEAEFELLVAALDPERDPSYESVQTWFPMRPVNVVEQFHGVTVEQASLVARECAHACVGGALVAETQAYVELDGQKPKMMTIKQAADLWHTTVTAIVEYYRAGRRGTWRWN